MEFTEGKEIGAAVVGEERKREENTHLSASDRSKFKKVSLSH